MKTTIPDLEPRFGAYSTAHNDPARLAGAYALTEEIESETHAGPIYRLRFPSSSPLAGGFVLNCYGEPATFATERGATHFAQANGLLPPATRSLETIRPEGYPGPFSVRHTNVDGAGWLRDADGNVERYATLAVAEAVAELGIRHALCSGNPWRYAYTVASDGWRGKKLVTYS